MDKKKGKYLAVLSAVLFYLIFLVNCISIPTVSPSPTASPSPSPLPTVPPLTTAPTTPPTTPAATIPSPVFTPPARGNGIALPSLADVVAKAKPSVVAINVEVVTVDIFNRPITREGAGSGWIIDKNGLIVTNNHVVEDARTITVTLADGRTFTADVNQISRDPLSDLAIVRINASGLPAATVGDSSRMRLGDWVVAIGNSLGRGIRVTDGIVSAQGVSLTADSGETLTDLIETTAAINPGNSGGPLVNLAGEVIGITSAKIVTVGVEAVGFAISSNTALPIIQQLVDRGRVIRPWLGVSAADVTEFLVITARLSVDKGAYINEVVPGSPAQKAGLRSGDVVVRFGAKDVASALDLVSAIRATQIGQTVEIVYVRGTARSTTTATMAERPVSP
ncbi:MAG: trypsin-like peptidase domain-containing protein [Chloroflexi bacterium]|nr:trypsin-like peptidase domain-containing protein [Chloroflexota bacterium]